MFVQSSSAFMCLSFFYGRVLSAKDVESDGASYFTPMWSQYEKAERKRLATKTRTGRVSKPPKHMVKDYRRIHRLAIEASDCFVLFVVLYN